MFRYLPLLLMLALTATGRAQTLTGVVASAGGHPLPQATVVLLADSGRTTVRFARTAADGRFSIDSRTKSGNTAFALLFTAMGYEKDTIAIAGFRNGQTVIMPEKSLQIKEVRVVAPRIVSRGDTLSYLVNSFKQKQDRSIADVIRKMPGLNVNDDGSIEYQGRRINKFYIEGMDLLGSKYAQASENIPADKVGSVQVLENHQPVKMLRGNSFSGQAALNITLKGEARGVWQATAGAAAGTAIQNGAGALADYRLTAMLFARKMQSMSMYKFNNTGKDIMREAADKYAFGYRPPEVQPLTSGISIAQPSLEHGRTSFNTSNMLATNWLVKTRHGHDLRMQLTAMHDRSAMSAYSETLHTDIDGNAMVTQSNEATATRREMEGEVTYQVNDGGIYLTNTLHAGGSWNKSRGSSVFNGNGTHLEAIPQKGSLGNAFSMTKRMKGGNSLSLSAYLSHSYLPAGLLIADGSWQQLDLNATLWGASAGMGHQLGRVGITWLLFANGKSQGLDINNAVASGHERYTDNSTGVKVGANCQAGPVKLYAGLPLAWSARQYRGMWRHEVTAQPSLGAQMHLGPHWDISLNYNCKALPQQLTGVISMPVYTDRSTMRTGSGLTEMATSHNLSAFISYKSTVRGLFASLMGSVAHTRGEMLYEGSISDGIYLTRATGRRTSSGMMFGNVRIAQSLRWARMNIGLSATMTDNKYKMMTGGKPVPCSLQMANMGADISMQPATWLSADAKSSLTMTRFAGSAIAGGRTMRHFYHNINVYIMPGQWRVEWRNEIFHSNDRSVTSCYFADIAASYSFKRCELGIELNNITGRDTYQSMSITTSRQTLSVNRLRPRELLARVRFSIN